MKRFAIIAFILCLCVGVPLCVPQIRHYVFFSVAIMAGLPLDDASAQVPRTGQCREFSVDDPTYDYVIYYFDGTKQNSPAEIASAGLKAIRRRGVTHKKTMTLVVFCNLTAPSQAADLVYPFGLFLESAAIRNRAVSVAQLAGQPIIVRPMLWDSRINEWVHTTNNATKNGPEVIENAGYVRFTNTLDRGWFMDLNRLKSKEQVYATFGMPRYYVRNAGTYSEIYPVEDSHRGQSGTVRIWYNGDRVTKRGCYLTNN
jgi:hypothetical protein